MRNKSHLRPGVRFAAAALILLAVGSVAGAAAKEAAPKPLVVQSSAYPVYANKPGRLRLPINQVSGNDGMTLTFTLVAAPDHGTVWLPDGTVWKNGTVFARYLSHRGFVGKDSFKWKVSNGTVESEVATFSVEVKACQPTPYDQTVSVVEGTPAVFEATYVGDNGEEVGIKPEQTAHGTLVQEGGKLRYTPKPGFTGIDSFKWVLNFPKSKNPKWESASATCWLVVKKRGMNDWPQYRADGWRSGFTTMALPAELHLQWSRALPYADSPFAARSAYPDIDNCRPVQMGKTIFVPVTASDSVCAYDTETGALRWQYFASGAVRRPPVAVPLKDGKALVIFGCDDGCVYALDAVDGKARWKFRAAPNNRMAVGFGRLSSVWPVWASPVAVEDKVYFAAGYLPAFGLFAYGLDAATGKVEWFNDGQITDMWNTSAFGPLAVSYDGAHLYGSVEGACRPWVLDRASGKFLGHFEVGFGFPGGGKHKDAGPFPNRDGSCGWYTDGKCTYNQFEPLEITAGARTVDLDFVRGLGVPSSVANMLAGDGKLFVTTVDGRLWCFGAKKVEPKQYPLEVKPFPETADAWTEAAKAMLSRNDLKQGLVLVWGLGRGADSGRLVEELAKQPELSVVAIDPDGERLQAFRRKMDAAGLSGTRVSTLQGKPLDFAFSPYIAALVASEDLSVAGGSDPARLAVAMYECARPFGGEVWLPANDGTHAVLAEACKPLALAAVERVKGLDSAPDGYTRIVRKGLPEEKNKLEPPFGVVAFGCVEGTGAWMPLSPLRPRRDPYSWLSFNAKLPDFPELPENFGKEPGYPTPETTTTGHSVFTRMINPLYGTLEKLPGLPSTGNDGACRLPSNRCGDLALTHGKIASVFDASSNYWGRYFRTESGGCPGRVTAGLGILSFATSPTPGNACGCSPALQVTDYAVAPMRGEESWVSYQDARTSAAVEELPIRSIGINLGAPGDRFEKHAGMLWTHHPHSNGYGWMSYNRAATPEGEPLVAIRYRGTPQAVYRHSAVMAPDENRDLGWIGASYVKGLTGVTIPLARRAVAQRIAAAPEVDGALDDACWDRTQRISFVLNKALSDPNHEGGQPGAGEECYAWVRYDDENLYVAAGLHGPLAFVVPKVVTVGLNSRERVAEDVVLTCGGKPTPARLPAEGWKGATSGTESDPLTAELSVSWKALEAAGLWKDQLVINISVAGSVLAGRSVFESDQYLPLYLDAPRGRDLAPRPYTVRLYFAEMEGKAPGERVFDVQIQGRPALSSFDVVKEAGGVKKVCVKEFKNVAISDALDIELTPKTGEALLSGVSVAGAYPVVGGAPNAPPVAKLEATVLAGKAPLEVTFSAQGSSDADGQIAECVWETGDGRLARGSKLRHVYTEPGTYTVSLLVRDNDGGLAAASAAVEVQAGEPSAFVCSVGPKGEFPALSKWLAAMRSDMTSSLTAFKIASRGTCVPADAGKSLKFKNSATGRLLRVSEHEAIVTGLTGQTVPGPVLVDGGHKMDVGDAGSPLGRSLLFSVKSRGTYAPGDDGGRVTFAGGGTGVLRHVNAQGLAYITHCVGEIQAGPAALASGHGMELADAGRSVGVLVAELEEGVLEDKVVVDPLNPLWTADGLRCVVIRPEKNTAKPVTLRGDFNLADLPFARIESVAFDAGSTLTLGPGSSLSRVRADKAQVTLLEGCLANHCAAETFGAAYSGDHVAPSATILALNWRDGSGKQRPPSVANAPDTGVRFYNCTAATFDPGNQSGVIFLNCLARPGGKGFVAARYSHPVVALRCVSADATVTAWDSGRGYEGNQATQDVKFGTAQGEAFRLAPNDTGALNHGGPALGADIDGEIRKGAAGYAGADAVPDK